MKYRGKRVVKLAGLQGEKWDLRNRRAQYDKLRRSTAAKGIGEPLLVQEEHARFVITTPPERYVKTALHRQVEHWLHHGSPPILSIYGPPGCGKTITVRHVLAEHAKEFPSVWIPATWGSDLETLLGVWGIINGETVFTEGDLLKGLTTPNCVIVIDDAHTVALSLQLLNGVGDITRELTCSPLSKKITIAEGVRLVLLANPPPRDLPPWERARWELPEQIRDRARMIELREGLSREDELAIASLYYPEGHPREVLEGLVELIRNLRTNGVLRSFIPSTRSLVMACQLLWQGLSLGEAYLQGVANKFLREEEYAAAIEAFRAKFGVDPRTGESGSKEVG